MAAAASAGRVPLRVQAQLRRCYRSGSQHSRFQSVFAVALPQTVSRPALAESRPATGAANTSGSRPLGDPLGTARAPAQCRRDIACAATKPKKGRSKKTASDYQDYTEAGDQHPNLPWPRNFQQTLKTSFTVSGIGLHTGEQVCVRVRPAFAGEGRYFVRVPDGTNARLAAEEDEQWVPVDEAAKEKELSPAEEERRTQLFIAYLNAQEPETDEVEAFQGTFEDYVAFVAREPTFVIDDDEEQPKQAAAAPPDEEIVPRSEGEDYVLANLDNATDKYRLCTTLESGSTRFITVEHLLSSLEGCCIDNARIEVEGGQEMPVIDGSSLGWCLQIQTHGVRAAPRTDGSTDPVEKLVLMPKQVVSVADGDKFITLYPGEFQERLTYGIDFSGDSPVIGKQWFTWARREDDHYTVAVAPARTFAPSLEAVEEMVANGYIRGGTHDVALVGDGKHWVDETLVRFAIDEQARHKMLDLIGDLSFLAQGGNQALPYGHIVAYKAGHSLHLKFARALRASCDSPDDWRPALPADLSLLRELLQSGGDDKSTKET